MWKNRIAYLVLLLYGTLLFILYDLYSMGLAVVILWLLPFVLLVLFAAGQTCIEVRPLSVGELAEKGDMLEAGFTVENRSFLPGFPARAAVEIRGSFGGSTSQIKRTVLLKGNSQRRIEIPIAAEHCGRLEIIYKGFWLMDYFKLWSFQTKARGVCTVRVLPELVELTGEYRPGVVETLEEAEHYSDTRPGEDASEIFGFHDYRPGDRLQGIHWKLSSKREELIVKEYSQPAVVTTGIWFDLWENPVLPEEGQAVDLALTALFSLSAALLEREWIHEIYFGGRRFLIQGEEELLMVFDVIYEEGFCGRQPLTENETPNLFYIGEEKSREKLQEEAGTRGILWMVDTQRIERILEDLYESDII